MDFGRFRVLTFDCYGTLIDWERGILAVLGRWAQRRGVRAGDEELLRAFAEAEARVEAGPFRLYPEVLRAVHGEIARRFGQPAAAEDADELARSVGDWLPFPDTVEALRRLQKRAKLVVVSNVDRASFARTQEKLETTFDAVVTAEEAGAYKPDLRMFRRALEVAGRWGAAPEEILHVAESLYHDHVPAKHLGLATVWVDRRRGRPGGATAAPSAPVQPDLTVYTLAELAARMGL